MIRYRIKVKVEFTDQKLVGEYKSGVEKEMYVNYEGGPNTVLNDIENAVFENSKDKSVTVIPY